MYGARISSGEWFKLLVKRMQEIGFRQEVNVDQCLMTYRAFKLKGRDDFETQTLRNIKEFQDGNPKYEREEDIISCIHVDDTISSSSNKQSHEVTILSSRSLKI